MPGVTRVALLRRRLALRLLWKPAALFVLFVPFALADVMGEYGGSEYEGRVDTHILLPDGRKDTRWGRGSASLVETAPGKAQLILKSQVIDEETRFEITLDGSYDSNGWQSDPGHLNVNIGPDGRVRGGGKGDGQTFEFSGEFSSGRALLETTVRMDRAMGGLPAGSSLTHDYRLQRDPPRAAASSSASGDGRRCKRMGMRNVPIAGLGGAGMTMASVPECEEYE